MEYILKIEDTEEAKSLISFLRSLKFVKIKDVKSDKLEKGINIEEFRAIIKKSEKTTSIPLIDAMEKKLFMEKPKEIIIKEFAFKQLEAEYNYYSANYSIEYAEEFRIQIFELINKILPSYNSNPECRFLSTKNKVYRNIIWNNYLIVYKINRNTIDILSIFHTKQNPDKLKQVRRIK